MMGLNLLPISALGYAIIVQNYSTLRFYVRQLVQLQAMLLNACSPEKRRIPCDWITIVDSKSLYKQNMSPSPATFYLHGKIVAYAMKDIPWHWKYDSMKRNAARPVCEIQSTVPQHTGAIVLSHGTMWRSGELVSTPLALVRWSCCLCFYLPKSAFRRNSLIWNNRIDIAVTKGQHLPLVLSSPILHSVIC